MANLKDLRKRLRSVTETKKITTAMKLVAAAKFRRAQEAYAHAIPFAKAMSAIFRTLCHYAAAEGKSLFLSSPRDSFSQHQSHRSDGSNLSSTHEAALKHRTTGVKLFIVIGSDKGLCGGFNAQLFRLVLTKILDDTSRGGQIKVLPLGNKAQSFFKRVLPESTDIIKDFDHLESSLMTYLLTTASSIDTQEIFVGYNKFHSAVKQEPCLVPLCDPKFYDPNLGTKALTNDHELPPLIYGMDPSNDAYYQKIVLDYLKSQLFLLVKESQMGEQGARMFAMDNATRNADEMIAKLNVTYNRQRQAQITTELTEILSGAEALA